MHYAADEIDAANPVYRHFNRTTIDTVTRELMKATYPDSTNPIIEQTVAAHIPIYRFLR